MTAPSAGPAASGRSSVCHFRIPTPPAWWAKWPRPFWLPTLVRPLLRCELAEGGKLRLCLGFTRWLLVEFSHSAERSTEDRQLFYITGGILARTRNNPKGRIEFREMLDRRWVLAAIHDYSPMLPWYFYSATQALVHLMVMQKFARHLGQIRDAELAKDRENRPGS